VRVNSTTEPRRVNHSEGGERWGRGARGGMRDEVCKEKGEGRATDARVLWRSADVLCCLQTGLGESCRGQLARCTTESTAIDREARAHHGASDATPVAEGAAVRRRREM